MDPVPVIAALSLAFVGSHLVFSHPPVRTALVSGLGRGPFLELYSLMSLALWLPLVGVWWTHRHAGTLYWAARGNWVVHLAELVAMTGLALMVAGVAHPAPTGPAWRTTGRALAVRGAEAITRHPLFMGIGLLSLAHVLVNGWVGDLWFCGAHLALAVLGALHQDQRHRAARPEYEDYMRATTLWPNPLGLRALDARTWASLGAGVALAVLIRFAHRWF